MIRSASLDSALTSAFWCRTLAQLRDRVPQHLSLTMGDAMASPANSGLSASRRHVLTGNAQAVTAWQAQSTKQTAARECYARKTTNASPNTAIWICARVEATATLARYPWWKSVRACSAALSGSNALLEYAFRIRAAQTRLAQLTKPPSRRSARVSCACLAMSVCSITIRTVHVLGAFVAKMQIVRPLLSQALPAAKVLNVKKILIASRVDVLLGSVSTPPMTRSQDPKLPCSYSYPFFS